MSIEVTGNVGCITNAQTTMLQIKKQQIWIKIRGCDWLTLLGTSTGQGQISMVNRLTNQHALKCCGMEAGKPEPYDLAKRSVEEEADQMPGGTAP